MRKSIITGAAVALSLAFAGTAQANTVETDFNSFIDGPVGGQGNWLASTTLDQEVVAGVVGGGKALRISNAVTNGGFENMMPFSEPVDPAGEGVANKTLVNEFKVTSDLPTLQSGLMMSLSPTDGKGNRMSYVKLEDTNAGIKVTFTDTPSGHVNPANHVSFDSQEIATLDRTEWSTIRFETTFVPGQDNDVVRVFVNGDLEVCGESWENYYRYDAEQTGGGNTVKPSDRLMWRISGTSSAHAGNGFLFDDVKSESNTTGSASCTTPPANGTNGTNGAKGADGQVGKDGVSGKNGANGVNGTNGVTTVVREPYTVAGATMRNLHVRKIAGMKFVGAKATLKGKKLKVKGRTIKVNLAGKSVGEYMVRITAKYKVGGKVYKVKSVRSLSITRS